jgi:ATP-dependent protease ClpP protease subunit
MNNQEYLEAIRDGRVLYCAGDIFAEMTAELHNQIVPLLRKHPRRTKVFLLLQTDGGDSKYGAALHDTIKRLNQYYEIYIIAEANVSSAGFYVLLSVPVRQRLSSASTTYFIHRPTLVKEYRLVGGPEEQKNALNECRAAVRASRESDEQYFNLIAKQTHMSRKEVRRLMKKPRRMYAKEAIKCGIIGKILS